MSADIFKDLTILLVEDHDDTRTYLVLFLARLGARILLARNAFEAVEAVRTFHPNIVLSDISMPDRDGFHLLRDIRSWLDLRDGHDEERVEEMKLVRDRLSILLQSSTITPDWRLEVPVWFEAEC